MFKWTSACVRLSLLNCSSSYKHSFSLIFNFSILIIWPHDINFVSQNHYWWVARRVGSPANRNAGRIAPKCQLFFFCWLIKHYLSKHMFRTVLLWSLMEQSSYLGPQIKGANPVYGAGEKTSYQTILLMMNFVDNNTLIYLNLWICS